MIMVHWEFVHKFMHKPYSEFPKNLWSSKVKLKSQAMRAYIKQQEITS